MFSGDSLVVAVDVETANRNQGSICQIGIAAFRNSRLVASRGLLVNPQQEFEQSNISVHSIRPEQVAGSPTLRQALATVLPLLGGRLLVSHTGFDRIAFEKAASATGLDSPNLCWLDSAIVARKTWPHCAQKGYGLSDLCAHINHSNKNAHNAEHDAIACGMVLHAACKESGHSPQTWYDLIKADPHYSLHDVPLYSGRAVQKRRYPQNASGPGNADGRYFGLRMVITGSLSIPREDFAAMCREAGFYVTSSVSSKTDVVVAGPGAGSKLPKAKEFLAKNGKPEIHDEDGFFQAYQVG